MTVSMTADSGATATTSSIDNTYGSIAATLSGAGNFNLGSITAALTAVSATVNASAATGTNVINTSLVSGTASITLASGSGADTVVVGDTGMGTVSITNFRTGTGGDEISFDISQTGTISTGASGVVADSTAADIGEISGASTFGTTAGTQTTDNIIVLTGAYFATAALAEASIEAAGSRALTLSANNATNDDYIIVWSDGSNSYVGVYNNTTNAGTGFARDLTVMVELVGVDASVSGTLVAANFDFET